MTLSIFLASCCMYECKNNDTAVINLLHVVAVAIIHCNCHTLAIYSPNDRIFVLYFKSLAINNINWPYEPTISWMKLKNFLVFCD